MILMCVLDDPDVQGHTFAVYKRFADASRKLRLVNKAFRKDMRTIKRLWRKALMDL